MPFIYFLMLKSEKVSMPVSSAGILSLGSDMELSGIKIDPKVIIITVVLFVLIIKVTTVLVG